MSITFDELDRLLDRDEQYAADIESRVSQGAVTPTLSHSPSRTPTPEREESPTGSSTPGAATPP